MHKKRDILSEQRESGMALKKRHGKQSKYVVQVDPIYHEMMALKNLHREYTGVNESTPEAWHHYEYSQSTVDTK